MSTALVRKGLEIVDPDFCATGKASKKNRSSLSSKNKQLKILQNRGKVGSTKKSKSNDRTLESIRRQLREDQDKTDLNLRSLQLLSSTAVDEATTKKILERAGKIKNDIVVEEVEEKTAFTEEDFEAFEKEYFVQ